MLCEGSLGSHIGIPPAGLLLSGSGCFTCSFSGLREAGALGLLEAQCLADGDGFSCGNGQSCDAGGSEEDGRAHWRCFQ